MITCMKNKKDIHKQLICLIFILIFLSRFYGITNEPYELSESWRQTDTYSIAVNFLKYEFNILKPQFNYDGSSGNYVQLELQIITFITALLFKIFGVYPIIARLVVILFFMGSVYYFYKIAKMFCSKTGTIVALVVYGFLPINIIYSRNIMPESCVLFFTVGALYYFLNWYYEDKINSIWFSGLFTALAISQKTPAIYMGLVYLVLFIIKYNKSFVKRKEFWIFGFISLFIPIIYLYYSYLVSRFSFVYSIAHKHIFRGFFTAIFSDEAFAFFKLYLPYEFGVVALILSSIGLIFCIKKKNYVILLWFIAFFIETITIVAVIKFGYYLIFLSPIISLLCGIAISNLIQDDSRVVNLVILFFVLNSWFSYSSCINVMRIDENILLQSEIIKGATNEDDLIVISNINPAYLNAANRRGWRANLDLYSYIPTKPEEEVSYFIENGADYFVMINNEVYNDGDSYKKLVWNNYNVIYSDIRCTIFDLDNKSK